MGRLPRSRASNPEASEPGGMEGPDDCGGRAGGFCPEGGLEGDWAGGLAGGRDGPAVPGMQPGVPPMVIGMPI